jgi:hypothetical protein
MKGISLSLALLLLASLSFAQDAGPGVPAARRIVFSLARDRAADITEGQSLMISRSMLARLQAARTDYIVIERPVSVVAPSESDLSAEAKDEGADGWISVTIAGGWDSMRIGVRCFDLLTNSRAVDQSFTRSGMSLGEIPREGWNDIVQAVAPQFRSASAAAPGPAGSAVAHLTVKARPGTRVTGLGPAFLEVGADGQAIRELPLSREYLLRGELPGTYPATARIFLSADREVQLRQDPAPQWALEASLQDAGYPRIDVTWFPRAGGAYVRLGLMTYALGLAFNETEIFSSAPLTNIEAQMGVFFGRVDSLFRFSFGIGCLVRVATVPGAYFGLDPLSPWGVRGIIGMEVSPWPRSRLFVELTPTVYMTPAPDVFRQLLGSGTIPPGWIAGGGSFAEIFSIRFGYRWML